MFCTKTDLPTTTKFFPCFMVHNWIGIKLCFFKIFCINPLKIQTIARTVRKMTNKYYVTMHVSTCTCKMSFKLQCKAACVRALLTERYASSILTYFPTKEIRTSLRTFSCLPKKNPMYFKSYSAANLFLLVKLCGNTHKFIIAELLIRKLGSSPVLIIPTDEDPSLRIESSAIINLRGVSTKLNKYIVFTMQTYKKLITKNLLQKFLLRAFYLCPHFLKLIYQHLDFKL